MGQNHNRRRIAPAQTFDGKALLPQEVPAVPCYSAATPARTECHRVATALFQELSARPVEEAVARVIEGWEITAPCAAEELVAADAACEPHEWGDSGELIEEWFRSGEQDLGEIEAEAAPPPTLLRTLSKTIRRLWARAGEEPEAAPELS